MAWWFAAGPEPGEIVRLGPFHLEQRVGAGATAEVWRARHHSGVLVAVKLLHPRLDARQREVMRREARAVAALRHPGIVAVFDVGEVGDDEAGGVLASGRPYLVLEYASAGSLAGIGTPLPWETTRRTLLHLLDALAHAHARGVVHLDIKPENLLLCGPADPRPGLKLTDFGAARDLREAAAPLAGTAWTMAPEQIRGETGRLGPWTDLYALGCVAWRMVTGRRPFAGVHGEALLEAHLYVSPGEPSGMRAPPGFCDWLLRALEKSPRSRFELAADAAHALRGLPGVDEAAPTSRSAEVELLDTLTRAGPAPARHTTAPAPVRAEATAHPPVPPTWRSTRWMPPFPDPSLGLALVAQRIPPLVGRDAERDELWAAFLQVAERGRPEVVHLVGPPGSGRTRLGSWLCERVEETGAGRGWMLHDPVRDLAEAVVAWHGLAGSTAEDAAVALAPWCGDPIAARTLAEIALGARAVEPRVVLAVLAAEVGRLARHRPVVLVLRAHPLVRALSSRSAPVLVVVIDDDPTSSPRIDLAPLSAADVRDALASLIVLDPDLLHRLAEGSEGSPDVALAAVRDLAARGALVPTPSGLALAPGTSLDLRRTRDHDARAAALLASLGPDEVAALHRLAVLGPAASWEEVAELGASAAVEAALGAGLLWEHERGVRFTDPDARRALHDEEGAAAHHDACARALQRLGAPASRLAPLLLRGSDPEAAVEVAWRGAHEPGRDLAGQRSLLREADAVLDRLGAPVHDPRRLRGMARLADVARLQGYATEARALGGQVRLAARDAGRPDIEARALSDLARAVRRDGDLVTAVAMLEQALGLAESVAHADLLAHVRFDLGVVLIELGRLEEAAGQLALSEVDTRRSGQTHRLGQIFRARYLVARQQGDLAQARAFLDQASEHLEQGEDALLGTSLLISLGVLAGARGDHDEAEAHFRLAAARGHALGAAEEHLARINLGINLSNRGRFEEARLELLACLSSPSGARVNRAAIQVFLLACEAARGDLEAYRSRLDDARRYLDQSGRADADLATALERAAGLCPSPSLADATRAVARAQWSALGRDDELARLDAVASKPRPDG